MTPIAKPTHENSLRPHALESPTQRLDRLLHASAAPLMADLSPVSLGLAWADWAWHLAVSPGRQMELAALGRPTGPRHPAALAGRRRRRAHRRRRRRPALSPRGLGPLAVQRLSRRLSQHRGFLARGRAHAGHDRTPCRHDALLRPPVAGHGGAGQLAADQPGGAATTWPCRTARTWCRVRGTGLPTSPACPMRTMPPRPGVSRSAATSPSRPARWCCATG